MIEEIKANNNEEKVSRPPLPEGFKYDTSSSKKRFKKRDILMPLAGKQTFIEQYNDILLRAEKSTQNVENRSDHISELIRTKSPEGEIKSAIHAQRAELANIEIAERAANILLGYRQTENEKELLSIRRDIANAKTKLNEDRAKFLKEQSALERDPKSLESRQRAVEEREQDLAEKKFKYEQKKKYLEDIRVHTENMKARSNLIQQKWSRNFDKWKKQVDIMNLDMEFREGIARSRSNFLANEKRLQQERIIEELKKRDYERNLSLLKNEQNLALMKLKMGDSIKKRRRSKLFSDTSMMKMRNAIRPSAPKRTKLSNRHVAPKGKGWYERRLDHSRAAYKGLNKRRSR